MANQAKMSLHSRAALQASKDMQHVIDSFDDVPFMETSESERTQKRRELLANAAPDIQAAMERGLPAYLAEKLAKADQ